MISNRAAPQAWAADAFATGAGRVFIAQAQNPTGSRTSSASDAP